MNRPLHSAPPAFGWSDDFLLGFDQIDTIHREFVEVVAALLHCADNEFLAVLDKFIEHATSHFGDEDAMMIDTGFPPKDCHIDEHAAVMASAVQVRERVLAGDIAIGRDFAAELARWFPMHAAHLDSALAHWMFKRQHGGKPLVFRRTIGSGAAGPVKVLG